MVNLRRPTGALRAVASVAVGLGVLAVTAYLTLIVAGRIVGPAQFAGLGALYLLLQTLGAGLFQPLEQEVARRRGQARSTGEVEPGLLKRALLSGAGLSALLLIVAVLLYHPTVRILGGQPQLFGALVVALPGYALCFVIRGELSGSRRMARYAVQLSVEGVFRLAGLGVLAALGVHTAAAYGWLFGAAPWIAAACSVIGLRRAAAGPTAPGGPTALRGAPLLAPLTLLLVSTLAAQVVIGAGPITAQLLGGTGEAAATGAFLAALVVVRLPVFLFTAVQPSMLPAMAAHVAAGRRSAFGSVLWRVLRMMGLVAVATFVITTALGPWGLRVLFGPDYILSRPVFALMGVSIALFMTAGVLGQALLALSHHHLVTAGWLAGLVGLAIGMMTASDLVGRAIYGLLVGAAAAVVAFALLLWFSLRSWQPTEPPDPSTVEPVGYLSAA